MHFKTYYGLGVLYWVPEARITEAVGREIFGRVLVGDKVAQWEGVVRVSARGWVARKPLLVYYYRTIQHLGNATDIQVLWADSEGDNWPPKPGVPPSRGGGVLGLFINASSIQAAYQSAKIPFFLEIFLSVGRLVEAEFGYGDAVKELDLGGGKDPRRRAHWLDFLPPSCGEAAKELASMGSKVHDLGSGGFACVNWDLPYKRPEKARLRELGKVVAGALLPDASS